MTCTARGSCTAIGELSLLEGIRGVLSLRPGSRVVRWIGDDCAVVRAGAYAAVSTDVMVDGTHFRLGQAAPEDAGWRALAGALSDVAAIGAEPGEADLSGVLPAAPGGEGGLAVHRGAEALASEGGGAIAGGALGRRGGAGGGGGRCRGGRGGAGAPPKGGAGGTAGGPRAGGGAGARGCPVAGGGGGRAPGGGRGGARPGDRVAVTGTLGAAAA